MAKKKITDLQLRDDFSDSCNVPTDDGIQSYRVTAVQIKAYILAAANIVTSMIADAAVTRAKIEAAQRLPIGAVMPFAGTTAPTGYLLCDGSAVSRTTYGALFGIIGTSHGSGDGSTTFNLPDYRGRFLRGVDGGVSRDPNRATRAAMATGGNTGDNVGSVQDDAFQGHFHTWGSGTMSQTDSSAPPMNYLTADSTNGGGGGPTATFQAQNYVNDPKTGNHGTARYANETRPLNAGVNFLIKT